MSAAATQLVAGVDVSRETLEKLRAYEALVLKWSPTINLVAPATLPQIWDRHILDSAQLLPMAPQRPLHWADLGSGAGFPGLVIAILLQETSAPGKVTLIESDQRKATFLRTCIRELALTANVITSRIEDTPPLSADVVSARALAPLPRLLPLVHRHLAPEGIALLPKGQSARSEVDEARKTWHFHAITIPSQTNPEAAVLRLERISRA